MGQQNKPATVGLFLLNSFPFGVLPGFINFTILGREVYPEEYATKEGV